MEFYVCDEMQKLRDKLDANNIPWEDASTKDSGSKDVDWWMCRTHFQYKGHGWSVIHGYGSYGGINPYGDMSGQLLEVMSDALGGEPEGYCIADYIWDLMEGV